MAGARVDEHVALRVGRDAGRFAQVDVVRKLQRLGGGVERESRAPPTGRRAGTPASSDAAEQQAAMMRFMESPPYRAAVVVGFGAPCGFSMIFWTRHDSISATKISFGLRQSIM